MAIKRKGRLMIAGLALLIAGVVGIPWLYINVIKDDPPPKLSFEQRDKQLSSTTPVSSLAS